ncbi:MAG: phospholipid/cholesterol/gamma-HCH transport system substrate-binding protein [Nocardioidaceae bacterium]|nr:phospholipid/cholesterol/gamma-HCH transport system substrate-binding protein [Nocardioidaceae bacterium]
MELNVSRRKTLTLVVFTLSCLAIFAYLYSGTGARFPLFSDKPYTVSFTTTDTGNVIRESDVRMAGVKIGTVKSVDNLGAKGAEITLAINPDAGPVHEGVRFRVAERSLVGEGAVEVIDGKGKALPDGTESSVKAVDESVQLRDVIASLDEPTRVALRQTLRSLGEGTERRGNEVDQLFTALDSLGANGYTAVDALAAQSDDLKDLAREAGDVLQALSVSQGQLGALVEAADTVTTATAGQSDNIEASMNELPGVLRNARGAVVDLEALGEDLRPVARDLNKAAPSLTAALEQLPATSKDLRGLLPSLDSTLDRAPATLKRVPRFSDDTRDMVPTLRETLSQANPIVGYLSPYGRDMAAFFTNFANAMHATDEKGIHYIRLEPIIDEQSMTGVPLTLPSILSWKNPYPAPGQSVNPGPEGGREFTRLYPEAK